MENTVLGMPPMQFITWLFTIVMFAMMASIFLIKEGVERAVKGKEVCVFITRSRKIEFVILEEEAGVIPAPPHHKFAEGQNRVYFVNRKFSLHGRFPPFIWSIFQATASFGVWEEGDSQPLLPSDEPPFVSPQMISSLINQNVIALIVKRFEEKMGEVGTAMGKWPWYVWAMFILTLISSITSAWMGLNILNILLKGGI